MSTFFFKTGVNSIAEVSELKVNLDRAKEAGRIENWRIHPTDAEHLLEIETVQLSSKETEHMIRALGVDAAFTEAPQAR